MTDSARTCGTGEDLPLSEVYAGLLLPSGSPKPYVALGMVASVDGAVSISGRSGALGGDADRVAFRALRSACDAILVGAGTVRAERYGPPSSEPDRVARRRELGLDDRPALAVVTGSGRIAADARLFRDETYRPLILTSQAGRVDHLAGRAEIVRTGAHTVDLAAALHDLGRRGYRRILCEGGPSLNAQLLEAGLVDELFLTVAPTLVGGHGPRLVRSEEEKPRELELRDVLRSGSELLLRYAVGRAAPADRAG